MNSPIRKVLVFPIKAVMFVAFLVILLCNRLIEVTEVDYSLLLGGTSEHYGGDLVSTDGKGQ